MSVTIAGGPSCPGRVVWLDLGPELRPDWQPEGHPVGLWLAQRLGPEVSGRALAHFVEGGVREPAIVEAEGRIVFRFDAEAAIAAIVSESYVALQRPLHTRVRLPYQLVPGPVRLALFRLLVKRDDVPFPASAIEPAVEALRVAHERASGVASGSKWPDGKRWAFVVSHDVDTAKGLSRMREVASFEASLGVRSTWFVVGDLFGVDPSVLADARTQGHEIGLHGDRHDNTIAYQKPQEIARRLSTGAAAIESLGVRGFRSPSLLETPALRRALRSRFAYASQVPDTEIASLVAPRRGCGTCFPFEREGLLEIPMTLPMEDKLIMQGMSERDILAHWRRKAGWVKQVGGVVQLSIHNEPHLLDRCRGAYEALVREAAADETAWRATLGEVAEWWAGKNGRS